MKRIEGDGIQIPESLLKRDTERKEKKLAAQFENSDDNKRFDYFCEMFKKKRQEIEEAFEETKKAAEVDPTSLAERFKETAEKIRLLNKFVFGCSCYLRAYDVRSSKEVIQSLEETARRLEQSLVPKKRFGFKTRDRKAKPKTAEPKGSSYSAVDGRVPGGEGGGGADACGFQLRNGERDLRLGADETENKDIVLRKLTDCTVVIVGAPNTLRIGSLAGCTVVVIGRVLTSVMVEESEDSSLAVSCQQVRVHASRNCSLYLDVTTGPIIEYCCGLGFAPYPPELASRHPADTWASVDDFDWLSATKPSPNWRILPQSERITDWPTL